MYGLETTMDKVSITVYVGTCKFSSTNKIDRSIGLLADQPYDVRVSLVEGCVYSNSSKDVERGDDQFTLREVLWGNPSSI